MEGNSKGKGVAKAWRTPKKRPRQRSGPKRRPQRTPKQRPKRTTQRRPKWRTMFTRTLHGRPVQKVKGNGQREHGTEGQNQRPKRTP